MREPLKEYNNSNIVHNFWIVIFSILTFLCWFGYWDFSTPSLYLFLGSFILIVLIHELSHMVMARAILDGGKAYIDICRLKGGVLGVVRSPMESILILVAPIFGVHILLTSVYILNFIGISPFLVLSLTHIVLICADVQGILLVYRISNQMDDVGFSVTRDGNEYNEWVHK